MLVFIDNDVGIVRYSYGWKLCRDMRPWVNKTLRPRIRTALGGANILSRTMCREIFISMATPDEKVVIENDSHHFDGITAFIRNAMKNARRGADHGDGDAHVDDDPVIPNINVPMVPDLDLVVANIP